MWIKTILFFIVSLIITTPIWAAPSEAITIVNHSTKECAYIVLRDECIVCSIPKGWESIDENQCPVGYTDIGSISTEKCEYIKDEFCCTEYGNNHCGMDNDTIISISVLVTILFIAVIIGVALIKHRKNTSGKHAQM
jgi:hypothetical protein